MLYWCKAWAQYPTAADRKLSSLLEDIRRRPQMYLGKKSVERLSFYLAGYADALRETGEAYLLPVINRMLCTQMGDYSRGGMALLQEKLGDEAGFDRFFDAADTAKRLLDDGVSVREEKEGGLTVYRASFTQEAAQALLGALEALEGFRGEAPGERVMAMLRKTPFAAQLFGMEGRKWLYARCQSETDGEWQELSLYDENAREMVVFVAKG